MIPLVDMHCHLLAGLDDGPRTWTRPWTCAGSPTRTARGCGRPGPPERALARPTRPAASASAAAALAERLRQEGSR